MNHPLQLTLPQLPGDFTAELAENALFKQELDAIFHRVFPDWNSFEVPALPKETASQREALRKNFNEMPLRLTILIRRKTTGEVVGWVSGEQLDWETFYLRNSGLVPEARRQGIYTALHNGLMEQLSSLGFVRVVSDHQPNSRAILLLKIRLGYCIQSMGLDERFGPLVRLVYFLNAERREYFESRYGLEKTEKENARSDV